MGGEEPETKSTITSSFKEFCREEEKRDGVVAGGESRDGGFWVLPDGRVDSMFV